MSVAGEGKAVMKIALKSATRRTLEVVGEYILSVTFCQCAMQFVEVGLRTLHFGRRPFALK